MDKIIDCHIHATFSDKLMIKAASDSRADFSQKGLDKEMKENGVAKAVAISLFSDTSDGKNMSKTEKTPGFNQNASKDIKVIAAINPHTATPESVKQTEELIRAGKIAGLKIYLGYYYFYPQDKIYHEFYNLAGRYNIPVIFHTGDTYSEGAKLKYANPLNIDEVAVDFPKTKFVIAHLGNPMVMVAAMVVYKNKNVYADISGFAAGDMKTATGVSKERLLEALDYCGYDRIMYGSDWPIAPMKPYIKLMKSIIPKKWHKQVFYENAAKLFRFK